MDKRNSLLLLLPAELMTSVYCQLRSFHDVFALATTCRRARQIWVRNASSIYRSLAPACISCRSQARRFLADQGGPAADCPVLSASDVRTIVRNSAVVEKAILPFEQEIVRRVKTRGCRPWRFYGMTKHPPNLTKTERPRFIRAYYRLWALLRSDPSEWQSRLEAETLKQLYTLAEVVTLEHNVGGEEVPELPGKSTSDGCFQQRYFAITQKRRDLKKMIHKHLEQTSERTHGRKPDLAWGNAQDVGWYHFIWMWDHMQPELKHFVCGTKFPTKDEGWGLQHPEYWDDSSDDEISTR